MKHIFIINSFTTKEKTDEVKEKLKTYCHNKKIDYVIEVNSLEISTEDIVKKYKNNNYIIIGIGGDGIINRILNGIMNTKNILGFIPYGTGNDFYKSVKKEMKEELTSIDVAKINNKYFINTSCFGIDADVANNKNIVKTKLIPKKQKYNIALIYTFFKYKCREFEVTIDKEKYNDIYTTIAICNGSYYGSGYNIAPISNLQDGLLDVYLVPKLNKLSMIKLILKMKKGKHQDSDKLKYFKTNKITLKSPKKVTCNIDGEELTADTFNIELIPKGIKIYYNEELLNYLKK